MQRPIQPVSWEGSFIKVLDQRQLPARETYLQIRDAQGMWDAIRTLAVRGAPAIGIAAAYGVVAEMQKFVGCSRDKYLKKLDECAGFLATSRPTAVNLFRALGRMREVGRRFAESVEGTAGADAVDGPKGACSGNDAGDVQSNADCQAALLEEARSIEKAEFESSKAIGENLLSLLNPGCTILTHCNAGPIATAGYGTALAPVLLGAERGISFKVFADETRPLLQGSRLTAWELMRAGVDVTVIADNMAGWLMAQGRIDAVIVGCDRVAANGDAANKIGTYSLAILAAHHAVPFYMACPMSTIDLSLASGNEIPIEERNGDEITCGFGIRTAPEAVAVYNPAFDVTPAGLITALVTERGIVHAPDADKLRKLL